MARMCKVSCVLSLDVTFGDVKEQVSAAVGDSRWYVGLKQDLTSCFNVN